jgi:hypothetical protein
MNFGLTSLAAPQAASSSVSRYSLTERRVAAVDFFRPFRGTLLVRVRPDQAGIGREALATDKPFSHAAPYCRLEQLAQEITIAEAAMSVLRESRVIRHIALETESAEPPIDQVQMRFLAEAALRANTEAVAHEQHPDHQLRVDRGPPDLTVKGPQVSAHARQVHEPINRAQQVIDWNMPFE